MIDTSRKLADVNQISNSSPGPGSVDAAYATLRAFAEQNGLEQPRSTAGLSKLADADSLLDFPSRGSSAKPSAAPKTVQRRAERSQAPRRRDYCRSESLRDLPCDSG